MAVEPLGVWGNFCGSVEKGCQRSLVWKNRLIESRTSFFSGALRRVFDYGSRGVQHVRRAQKVEEAGKKCGFSWMLTGEA